MRKHGVLDNFRTTSKPERQTDSLSCHINQLPVEVLLAIWHLGIDAAPSRLIAVEHNIRRVCRYWKGLADQTPALYTVLSTRDPPLLLSRGTTKSENQHLSIFLEVEDQYSSTSNQRTDPTTFMRLLLPHVQRWKLASLNHTGMDFDKIYSGETPKERNAPNLEVLFLHDTSSWRNHFTLSAPRLRQADFKGLLWSNLGRRSPNLTSLGVDSSNVSMEDLISVLSKLPKLEKLRLTGAFTPTGETPEFLEALSIWEIEDTPPHGYIQERPFARVSCPNWTVARVCLDLRAQGSKPSHRDYYQFCTAFYRGAEEAFIKFYVEFPQMRLEARDQSPAGIERVFTLEVWHREPFSVVDWVISVYKPDQTAHISLEIANIDGKEKYLSVPLSQATMSRVNVLHMRNITAGIHSIRRWAATKRSLARGIRYPFLKEIQLNNCDLAKGDLLAMTKACGATLVSQGSLQSNLECLKVNGAISEEERGDLEAVLGDKFVYNAQVEAGTSLF